MHESGVFIIGIARTPIGKFGGKLRDLSPADLGAIAIRGCLRRAGIEPGEVGAVVMGHVIKGGHGQLTAKQAAVKAGIPQETPAVNVDMVCSSSHAAIALGIQTIRSGDADVVVAGGMESMSQSYVALHPSLRWGFRFFMERGLELVDMMYRDGLTDSLTMRTMGSEAEDVIREWGITREELDRVAYTSHIRAAEATNRGHFRLEIVPVEVGRETVDSDEGIRVDTSLEKLARLGSVFRPDGLLTAGNSSQLSDGAAALVLASEEKVREAGLKPVARILGYASSGIRSDRFIEGILPATKRLLVKLGASIRDFDLFEVNEAFAVSPLLFEREFGVPKDRVNVFGGAIALGHPIGATGARIVVTLVNALRIRGLKRGISSLCHGTGGGTGIAVEML